MVLDARFVARTASSKKQPKTADGLGGHAQRAIQHLECFKQSAPLLRQILKRLILLKRAVGD
jgi:hypothetical protein